MSAPTPPSVELHVHVEATLEPELIFELAARNDVTLPYRDIDDLRARYAFTDLGSFLELYYANMAGLRTREDFADMTRAYLARAVAAGVRHVELFFDPQAHLVRGVVLTELRGHRVGPSGGRGDLHRAHRVLPARPPGRRGPRGAHGLLDMSAAILGIGLDSAEVGHPPGGFAEVYDLARSRGLHLVAHAGEEGPAEYVREALDVLGVERVDHGIRCLDDDALVDRLVADRVPLTVCPLSNVHLRTVDTMADHPLAVMLARGLCVSVHSDDPAYFGGYVDANYAAVVDDLDLDCDDLRTLARNGVEAAFVTPQRAAELYAEIDAWQAAD